MRGRFSYFIDWAMNIIKPIPFDSFKITLPPITYYISDSPKKSRHPNLQSGRSRAMCNAWDDSIDMMGANDRKELVHLDPQTVGEEQIHMMHMKFPDKIADVHKKRISDAAGSNIGTSGRIK